MSVKNDSRGEDRAGSTATEKGAAEPDRVTTRPSDNRAQANGDGRVSTASRNGDRVRTNTRRSRPRG